MATEDDENVACTKLCAECLDSTALKFAMFYMEYITCSTGPVLSTKLALHALDHQMMHAATCTCFLVCSAAMIGCPPWQGVFSVAATLSFVLMHSLLWGHGLMIFVLWI